MQTLNNDEKAGKAEMQRVYDSVGDLAVPGGKRFSYRDSLDKTANTLFSDSEKPLKAVTEQGEIVDYSTMFDVRGNLLSTKSKAK